VLHDFTCPLGHVTEELYGVGEDVPTSMVCPREGCGMEAKRSQVYVVRFRGAQENLERMEGALLTRREREAGIRFRSEEDVAAYEASKGIHRSTDYEQRVEREEMSDLARDDRRVLARDGSDGLSKKIEKDSVKEETDWNDIQYHRWKDTSNAVEHDLASGALRPDASGG
jgi:hypothetical protein